MSEQGQPEALEMSLEVNNALGLHARAAARIAEVVQTYDCQVILAKDGVEADGSSVLSILTLDASTGSRLVVRANGPQAPKAMAALKKLFADYFGEGR